MPRVAPIARRGKGQPSRQKRMCVSGYIFPSSGVSPRKRLQEFGATHSLRLRDLPVINTTPHFFNPNNEPILHATVIYMGRTYLVSAFFDSALDPNTSLLDIDGTIKWRGDLAIFSCGRRVTLLSRPTGSTFAIKQVARMFIRRTKQAIDSRIQLPQTITWC